mgnify:CR=1 FL=1
MIRDGRPKGTPTLFTETQFSHPRPVSSHARRHGQIRGPMRPAKIHQGTLKSRTGTAPSGLPLSTSADVPRSSGSGCFVAPARMIPTAHDI